MQPSNQRVTSAVLLVLAGAATVVIQYCLVNVPIAVDVDDQKIAPAKAKLNQEQLLIKDAIDDSNGILFLMEGQINELIDVHFDQARLSEKTLESFANETPPPPKELERIDFFWVDVREELRRQSAETGKADQKLIAELDKPVGSEDGGCKTFIRAKVANGSRFPTYQRYYQTKADDQTRDFYMSVDSELSISISVSPLIIKDQSDPFVPGCGKKLQVGAGWEKVNAGYWEEIEFIAPANSIIHFTAIQAKGDALWKQKADLFEPFRFGSTPLRAKNVTVQPLTATARAAHGQDQGQGNCVCELLLVCGWDFWIKKIPPSLAVTAQEQPLAISKFSLNNEMVQLDFSGTAWVEMKGQPLTRSFLKTVMETNPVFNAALGLIIAALLFWFVKVWKDIFKKKTVDEWYEV
jgi:hypothetical protein